MKTIVLKENFPAEGEAYLVGEQTSRYFFAWGSEYPYMEELPEKNISEGEGGIEWYLTEGEAIQAYLQAVEAWGVPNNIKTLLEEEGKSIRGLSRYLDMSYSNTHGLVNREDLSTTQLGTLLKVADYLNVSIEELYNK